jgi:hypothetical protein
MNNEQVIMMILFGIILVASMVVTVMKTNKSNQTKESKIQSIIVEFSETIIRLAKSVIDSLEIDPEDYASDQLYKRALAELVARDFRIFLEDTLPKEEYESILNLLDETTLINMITLILNLQVPTQTEVKQEIPPDSTKENEDSE